MHGSHDPLLVLLSVVIASVAGYVALDLAGRVAAARGSPRVRAGWLAGGALAMGIGIWDMHFVGMLAFGLHTDAGAMPIAYDVPLVLLSVAVAVVASALALAAAGRERLAPAALTAAALLMGAAIAGMHYIGMAALRVAGRVSYVPSLVAASILIAVVASGVALGLAFRLRGDETGRGHRRRVAAAALIGVAIAGMHYTAMAAARFTPPVGGSAAMPVPAGSVLATAGLAWSVGGATLAILVLALLGAALDRQLRARAARAEEFRRLYEAAEEARLDAGRAHELLQEQATELEQQAEEAEALAEELEQTNEELRGALAVADRATVEAELAAARTVQLQAVTAALSASLTPAEVARVVIEHGLAALGARAGSVATVDAAADELVLLGAVGYPAHAVVRFGRIPLDAEFPLAETVRSGAPIILATAEERAARYPRLAELREANGDGAMAAVPLTVEERRIGALGINFPPGVAPTEADRRLLLALAQQCAQALDRARLFEAEAASRREAQDAERRLAFLADAGAALAAGMLDYEATLANTARLAVPTLADYCLVDLLDGEGRLRRLAEAHVDPAMEALLQRTRRYYPAAADDGHPLRAALAVNEPRLVAEVTDAWIASATRVPEHLADVRTLGPRSVMVVPLRASAEVGAGADGTNGANGVPVGNEGQGGAYGVVTFVATAASGRRFTPADLSFAVEFVRRAALAVAAARAFVAERAALAAAEAAERRMAFLAEASAHLAGSLDAEATLAGVAGLAVPRLGDWCAVELLDGEVAADGTIRGTLRRLAVAHVDPAKVAWARELRERYPPDLAATSGLAQVLRTGTGTLYADVPDALLATVARDGEHLRLLRAVGFTSALVVPLVARGRTLGAITLVSAESGRRYTSDDLALATELARRAALAVDNARLFRDAESAREAAEHANAAKSEFLAVMSHELRTPINAVLGYADLMALGIDGPITEAQRHRLERIRATSAHLGGLVNEILDFAKLESGELTVGREMADAARAADAALAFIAPQAAAKGLAVDLTCGGDGTVRYTGDAQRVQQILINLLSNAVKFTEPGGRIVVRCATDAGPPPSAPDGPGWPDGPDGRTPGPVAWTCLVVEDTGIGIAADQLDAIFEPFVQLDTGLTRAKGGTGLGLAISRQLARAMGGELTVASVDGAGSRFTLWLPAADLR